MKRRYFNVSLEAFEVEVGDLEYHEQALVVQFQTLEINDTK
jgi:hypothetical protein